MATHDYNLANQSGASFRSDLNDALQAILTNNSSASAPSTTAAYMFWADTNTGILKIRNSANDAWVELLQLDGTLTLEDGSASAVALGFRDELNTGIFSSGASNFDVSIAGTTRLNISATGLNVTGGITTSDDLTIPDKIIHSGDTNTAIRFPADDTFTIETAGSETLRVDSNGRLSISLSTARASGGVSGMLQVERADANGAINIVQNQNNAAGSPSLILAKSRGTSVGSNTVVANNDTLGAIKFAGADGTDLNTPAAQITGQVDGTPGSDDMPGRLIFSTNSGSSSVAERMRIGSDGKVGVGTTSPSARFEIIEGSTGRSWTPASHTELLVERNGNTAISIIGEATSNCQINFGDENDENPGIIDYDHAQNDFTFFINGAGRFEMDIGAFHPTSDDVQDVGRSGNRFDDIRATNGSIVTSDRNEKNTIVASDLGLDFVNKLTPVSYKFNNKTRTHYGLIAQDIETLLGTIGKSATDFAGFCKDEITFKTEIQEDGKPVEVPLETPFDRYSLRYTEFIAPIIKAIQELSAKVTALEGS